MSILLEIVNTRNQNITSSETKYLKRNKERIYNNSKDSKYKRKNILKGTFYLFIPLKVPYFDIVVFESNILLFKGSFLSLT